MVSMSCLSRIVLLLFISFKAVSCVPGRSGLAFLVFGDSMVDYGNNNYLITEARADAPPYGIDYPTHRPTGRFSNGLNLPDIIADKLGLGIVLPSLSPELKGKNLLVGANFASAGIGILNETGIQFFNIIRIQEQLRNFEKYQQQVTELVGAAKAKKLVNEAVVLITLGGNDFVNNYFIIPYPRRVRLLGLRAYVKYLIFEYEKILMRLYELGARRILVPGLGPMGCAPAIMAAQSRDGECVAELQKGAVVFNQYLLKLVTKLNLKVGSLAFVTADTYLLHMDMFAAPQKYGFITSKVACCGQGPYNGIGLCNQFSNVCKDRNLYLFWDAFHPCERATKLMVQKMVADPFNNYMHPMNLSNFMAMDTNSKTSLHL